MPEAAKKLFTCLHRTLDAQGVRQPPQILNTPRERALFAPLVTR